MSLLGRSEGAARRCRVESHESARTVAIRRRVRKEANGARCTGTQTGDLVLSKFPWPHSLIVLLRPRSLNAPPHAARRALEWSVKRSQRPRAERRTTPDDEVRSPSAARRAWQRAVVAPDSGAIGGAYIGCAHLPAPAAAPPD